MTFQSLNQKQSNKLPKLKIWWTRFRTHPSANFQAALKRPLAFAVVGGTGAGKSALIETIASKYDGIIDLFGSRDNEGLAWLRSPFKDSVLLLKGDSVELDCHCADVKNAKDLTLKDMDDYKVIISCGALYTKIEEEYYQITKIMGKLWKRQHWKTAHCLLIREASNLIYSRLSLGETQQFAKAYLIYVIREMRHCGFAVALDTVRWYGIDINLRSIADYTFIKAQGIDGLPGPLKFLYRYFNPYAVMKMPVHTYIVASRKGPLGFGTSTLPYWHKREHENMLDLFDIRPSHKEIPFTPKGMMAKVGDYQHVSIIKARFRTVEKTGKKTSMAKLAREIGRSSATIHTHIHHHNNMVHAVGECDKCARVNSELAKVVID